MYLWKTLDVNDCDIGTCQGCGEYLMPEDIAKLEKELGIKKEAPEVEPPKLVPEGGIKVPEMMECKTVDILCMQTISKHI